MKQLLAKKFWAGLFENNEPPYLSLYQPTHRHSPENQQDPIRFRNLVKTLMESLRQNYPTREIQSLIEPFQALAADRHFWDHTLDGLAVLGAAHLFRVYRLQRPVGELAVAAESFHLKPLIRFFQSVDRYQILGLNRKEIKLFEGNRDALDEIELAPGVPRTITEALGEELTEPHQTVASYGLGAGTPIRHGHGGKKDELESDTERFFRAVDRAVLEHHSKPSGLPLILAALPEYHTPFHQVSHNPFLLADGLGIHPEALNIEDLRNRAWEVVEPQYLARLGRLVEDFGNARSRKLGSEDLAQVAEAAASGRVETLLLDADCQVPGRFDTVTGSIELDDLADPEVDDLLDDLGQLVLAKGGQVVVVPGERMPTRTGIAAIYRF